NSASLRPCFGLGVSPTSICFNRFGRPFVRMWGRSSPQKLRPPRRPFLFHRLPVGQLANVSTAGPFLTVMASAKAPAAWQGFFIPLVALLVRRDRPCIAVSNSERTSARAKSGLAESSELCVGDTVMPFFWVQ